MNIHRFTTQLILAATLLAAAHSESLDVELQRAIQQETVGGDLKAAIDAYKKIVGRAGANRSVAAKALVQMGECYRKLGDDESRKAFERVVREYADQKEAVSQAKARLGGVSQRTRQSQTLLWSGSRADGYASISNDGRYLSYVDWDTGDLALRDMSTGASRRLTNKGSWQQSGDFAEESTISRDGRQIAYSWFNSSDRLPELRVGNLSGEFAGRRLYHHPDLSWIDAYDWSPDGNLIVVRLIRKDRTHQIGLVSTLNGSLRVLKSLEWQGTRRIFLSPDGRYLAYDLPESEGSRDRDVFVLAVDSAREVAVTQHRGSDMVMGWSPDGKRILFASDRSGSMSLWSRQFLEGRPQGAPELVKSDIGLPFPIGVSRSGAIYYVTGIGGTTPSFIHIAPFDLATGRMTGAGVDVPQDANESNGPPTWSPDGRFFAHLSQRAGTFTAGPSAYGRVHSDTLVIRSAADYRVVAVLRPKLSYFAALRWHADGSSLFAVGKDTKGRQGIFRIDATTADVTPVRLCDVESEITFYSLGKDVKTLYFSQRKLVSSESVVLFERDLASGAEKQLMKNKNVVPENVSPDGRYLVIYGVDAANGANFKLLMSTQGGEIRELARISAEDKVGWIAAQWAPDSRSFFAIKRYSTSNSREEIWRMPIDGSAPTKVEGLSALFQFHPDGKNIGYSVRETVPSSKLELWALENFLPTLTAKK